MSQIKVRNTVWEIPEKGSPCDQWKVYFDKLKKEVGKDNAKTIWLVTWNVNGSTSCTTNDKFNKWLKKNEIDVSSSATRAVADISKIGSNILGSGKGITKIIQIGLPITLGIVLLLILFLLIKAAKEIDIKDAAAMAIPTGRAAKLMK